MKFLATNSTLPIPNLPNLPTVSIPQGYDFFLAFIPAAAVIVLGIVFNHKLIALLVGLVAVWFGPNFFPSIFNFTIFSVGTLIVVSGLSLTFYATIFCFLSLSSQKFQDITGTLGPSWGPIVLILIALCIGYVLGAWYPQLVDQLLHSTFSK
jgi:hypothetical protein